MSGIAWAVMAGGGFGFFQAVNRRANQLIDPYRGTFRLLLIAVVVLGAVTVTTQDLALVRSAPWWAFPHSQLRALFSSSPDGRCWV